MNETERAAVKETIHKALHELNVRIVGLEVGDCHCNLVAEVILDALVAATPAAPEPLIGPLTAAEWCAFRQTGEDDDLLQCCSITSNQVGRMLHAAQERLSEARTLRVMRRSLEPLIDKQRHSPAKVRAWLTAHGWKLFQQHPECSEWTTDLKRPGWLGEGSIVMVLDSTRFSDYAHHLAAIVTDLAGLHGMGELGVLAGIEAAVPQDGAESDAGGLAGAVAGTSAAEAATEAQRGAEGIPSRPCTTCDGTGTEYVPFGDERECTTCDGAGWVAVERQTGGAS
jgi:hypothetical protein